MTDKIANALNMVPFDGVKKDQSITTAESVDVVPYETEVDPQFEQACQDFADVRENMRELISQSKDMFEEVRQVAVQTQNPDQYNAAARFMELSIRANRELMNTHRDIFSMKPPAPPTDPVQKAEQINNIIFQGTTEDLLDMLKNKGLTSKS